MVEGAWGYSGKHYVTTQMGHSINHHFSEARTLYVNNVSTDKVAFSWMLIIRRDLGTAGGGEIWWERRIYFLGDIKICEFRDKIEFMQIPR